MNEFSRNLRRQLEIKNISQSDLARRMGVTRQSVSRWANGEPPAMTKIIVIAEALNCPVEDLIQNEKPSGEVEIAQIYRDLDEEHQRQLLDFGRWLNAKR